MVSPISVRKSRALRWYDFTKCSPARRIKTVTQHLSPGERTGAILLDSPQDLIALAVSEFMEDIAA